MLVVKLNVFNTLLASLKKNVSTPLTPPPPRAPPAGLFTSPPPPLVIRKQQGGGTSNLVPNFQNDILLPVIRVSPKEISKGWSSCQPDEKLKNIGLTCPGT